MFKKRFIFAAEELIIEDTDIKWEADDFGNEEISEEEQARLLEQYEAEIMEREKRKSLVVPLEEKVRVDFHFNEKFARKITKFYRNSSVQMQRPMVKLLQRKTNRNLNRLLKKVPIQIKNRIRRNRIAQPTSK